MKKKLTSDLSLTISKHKINITNPDKIFFPDNNITKLDVIEYYKKIAPIMVKYTKNRPLTMMRYPHGINEEGFYHKDSPEYFPEWIKKYSVPTSPRLRHGFDGQARLRRTSKREENKIVHYVLVNDKATLVYLANYGCLVYHLWLSKIDKENYPDKMIFDLDPSNDKSFNKIRETALKFKKIIEEHDLVPFVMSTGSRGLHVVVPIKRTKTFDEVKEFAQYLAQILIKQDPKSLTMELRKDKRGNRIFIDTLRNGYGATAVSPYSIRAKKGAPVSFPLTWKEIQDPKLIPTKYNIFTIFDRLQKFGDLWKDINKFAKTIKFK